MNCCHMATWQCRIGYVATRVLAVLWLEGCGNSKCDLRQALLVLCFIQHVHVGPGAHTAAGGPDSPGHRSSTTLSSSLTNSSSSSGSIAPRQCQWLQRSSPSSSSGSRASSGASTWPGSSSSGAGRWHASSSRRGRGARGVCGGAHPKVRRGYCDPAPCCFWWGCAGVGCKLCTGTVSRQQLQGSTW